MNKILSWATFFVLNDSWFPRDFSIPALKTLHDQELLKASRSSYFLTCRVTWTCRIGKFPLLSITAPRHPASPFISFSNQPKSATRVLSHTNLPKAPRGTPWPTCLLATRWYSTANLSTLAARERSQNNLSKWTARWCSLTNLSEWVTRWHSQTKLSKLATRGCSQANLSKSATRGPY